MRTRFVTIVFTMLVFLSFSVFSQEIIIKQSFSPAETIKGKPFSRAFSVTYMNAKTKEVVQGLRVTTTYPIKAVNGEYTFTTIRSYTDGTGTVHFMPEETDFACDSEITFSAGKLLISFPYKVKTNMQRSGTSIAITDLSKNGSPLAETKTSSLVLRYLLKDVGFSNTGNADLPQEVINDNADEIQKTARAMFQNNVTTLIYGATSYTAKTTENGVSVTLSIPLRVRLLKENKEVFRKTLEVTATNQSEGKALIAARDKMAQIIAETIKYTL